MEWNENNIVDMIEYINIELDKNRTMKDIEMNDFAVNDRVIAKRLSRKGYKKVNGRYEVTGKITPFNPSKQAIQEPTARNNTDTITSPQMDIIEPLKCIADIDKLNLLITNIDKILALVDDSKITRNLEPVGVFRSGKNDVTSIRIDTGIYTEVKSRAKITDSNISDIVNRALEEYLNNYI
ncbi:MAG: hypothetical protein ACRC3Y_17960 [Romboutsia sp.]|uniref:hypothetical protein n=1 Tax=Romboutsia sp. TaxID=1965302 RepID=UPI003F3D819A